MATHSIQTTPEEDAALTEVVAWRNAAIDSVNAANALLEPPGPVLPHYTATTYLREQITPILAGYIVQVAADAENHLLLKYREADDVKKEEIDTVAGRTK